MRLTPARLSNPLTPETEDWDGPEDGPEEGPEDGPTAYAELPDVRRTP
ncbi:hypothetical protein [Streptomyces sp. NBC_00878]|nr:hypothetical protein [Streptomyces sp. NBC_00878]MCX4908663.1 hypothetical protein [Streptomyces sp. NBC_00878]